MLFPRVKIPRTEQQCRRSFLRGSLAFVLTTLILPVFKHSAAQSYADTVSLDESANEIAALGNRFRELQPDAAGRLDMLVREAVGLTPSDNVDLATADKARLLLTERSRVAAELSREEVVFVDGWMLTNSEAGTALLYAAASAGSGARSQSQAVK